MNDQFKDLVPQVNITKNGYEIRTKILELALSQHWQDFEAKMGEYGASIKKEGNVVVTNVTFPSAPGVDQILETAQKFYDFVNLKK